MSGSLGTPHVPVPAPPPSSPHLQGWQCHHSVLCPLVPGTAPGALAQHPPPQRIPSCLCSHTCPLVTQCECPWGLSPPMSQCIFLCLHACVLPMSCTHAHVTMFICVPHHVPMCPPTTHKHPHTHTSPAGSSPHLYLGLGVAVSVGTVALGGDGASGQEYDEDKNNDAHKAKDDEQLHILPPVAPGHLLGRRAEVL